MKSSIRDKTEGTFHEAKGKVKEKTGELIDNPELEAEGTAEKVAGKIQKKVGDVKEDLGK
ncbi:MAG: CsbD family protein [Deferrisomatales bacterium]|nr:CsbD family protein [Deferrisomatales bacterium]